MSRDYTTWRRFRGSEGGRGRLAHARSLDDLEAGVGLIPDEALRVVIDGALVTRRRELVIRPISAGSFVALLDGEEIARGGIVGVFTALGRRVPSRFSVPEDGSR